MLRSQRWKRLEVDDSGDIKLAGGGDHNPLYVNYLKNNISKELLTGQTIENVASSSMIT